MCQLFKVIPVPWCDCTMLESESSDHSQLCSLPEWWPGSVRCDTAALGDEQQLAALSPQPTVWRNRNVIQVCSSKEEI